MKIAEALYYATRRLKAAGIEEHTLESEYLVAAALGAPRLNLVLSKDQALEKDRERDLLEWIRQRTLRKPLSYVLGVHPFLNLSLKVDPSVLIPRPETELFVAYAQDVLNRMRNAWVVDVGTGSGNIAISLACHSHVSRVTGIDISENALEVARENARRHRAQAPLQWVLGDLLLPLAHVDEEIDLIVANLPYVRTSDLPHLAEEVRWEPRLALDGGEDGLRCIARLISQSEPLLKPGGFLLMEMGADQAHPIVQLLSDTAVWEKSHIYKDLAGHSRMIAVQKMGS